MTRCGLDKHYYLLVMGEIETRAVKSTESSRMSADILNEERKILKSQLSVSVIPSCENTDISLLQTCVDDFSTVNCRNLA